MSKSTVSAPVLESALSAARREGMRLFTLQRCLFAAAIAGAVLIGLRGLVAIGWPATVGAPLLAGGLAALLVASSVGFAMALRARQRMERLTRDVQTLEIARDALDREAAPRVEVHPYRAANGEERPVVVIRTDSVERLFCKDRPHDEPRVRSWAARTAAAVVVLGALAVGATVFVGGESPARHRWRFLDETSDPGTLGFRIGVGHGGTWALEQHETATGARALVNRIGDPSAPPAILLAGSLRARDVRASTRCKVATAMAGDACGIVFRVLDDKNHHVARLDVAARRIVVAVVAGGGERVLGATSARIESGVWQELSVEARGDRIRVSSNGRDVIDVADATPAHFGSVGLWAPAAAEVYFDELVVETLPAAPQALEVLPLLGKGNAS